VSVSVHDVAAQREHGKNNGGRNISNVSGNENMKWHRSYNGWKWYQ